MADSGKPIAEEYAWVIKNRRPHLTGPDQTLVCSFAFLDWTLSSAVQAPGEPSMLMQCRTDHVAKPIHMLQTRLIEISGGIEIKMLCLLQTWWKLCWCERYYLTAVHVCALSCTCTMVFVTETCSESSCGEILELVIYYSADSWECICEQAIGSNVTCELKALLTFM